MASVFKRAEASDATIYMIGQGRALQASALQQLMKQLAAGSGGRAFFSDEDSEARDDLPGNRRGSPSPVLLGIPRPTTRATAESHRIRVEVPGRGTSARPDGYRMSRNKPQ